MPTAVLISPDKVSCLSVDTVSVGLYALREGLDAADLLAAARAGRFPPRLVDRDSNGDWQVAATAEINDLASCDKEGRLWLHGVSDEIALLTAEWCAHQRHMESDHPDAGVFVPDIAEIVEWCSVAEPCPLTAKRSQFMWWASHTAERARDVAARWESVSEWYGMLWEAGVKHSRPSRGTVVCVSLASVVGGNNDR